MRRFVRLGVALTCLVLPHVASASAVLEGTVVWVYDGDTIAVALADRVERVRYIGIDAPEVDHHGVPGQPGGVAATRANQALVAGRRVRLELDTETRDRYGRLLAYVWTADGMANAALVRGGWARTLPIPPNVRYAAAFLALEGEARAARRGLWGAGAEGPAATAPPNAGIRSRAIASTARRSCRSPCHRTQPRNPLVSRRGASHGRAHRAAKVEASDLRIVEGARPAPSNRLRPSSRT